MERVIEDVENPVLSSSDLDSIVNRACERKKEIEEREITDKGCYKCMQELSSVLHGPGATEARRRNIYTEYIAVRASKSPAIALSECEMRLAKKRSGGC